MKILHVVGARPNFMKVAPVIRALAKKIGIRQILVHTGQHYDINMSDIFFQQLGIPTPDINLEVGSGSHAVQTAQIMMRMEAVLLKEKPDLVLVPGDVNSTLAASLVCAKLRIPVGHVEAGLRSFDRTMPEEINRLLTDQIADLLFTPSVDGDENLIREGIPKEKIHLVGNVMIDTLVRLLPSAEALWPKLSLKLNVAEKLYGLVTLHRPSNVDHPIILSNILRALRRNKRRVAHHLSNPSANAGTNQGNGHRNQNGRTPAAHGAYRLSGLPLLAAAGKANDHRFRWHPGRNDFFEVCPA